MLGYGLVQVPLDVYHHSRTSYMLSHIQFKLSKRYISKLCLQIKFNDSEDYRATAANELTDLVTEKQLIKLHGLLKKNTHIHHRVQASWINMIHEAFYIEDVLNNENNTNHSIIKQSPLPRSWLRQKLFDEHPVLEWYIFFLIRPWALRILAIS
ncbi:unnamed protein product [Rotaria magnacalcarata]|uniref:Uncharacterized protein n=2 Tax=Rotaria magnacalcarata TaxID=392030 RepID=A0A815W8H1_9BILA|nr:unnamed protein product [Rotaria magnacalcarata]CAF1578083.1 unnamed protein product [Rotaria magnacalcarata]